jgi:NAD(P)-dependent dehydrogenase (short-subunit alcohol dehydrogenase family)
MPPVSEKRLKDRVALVTGASRGGGKGIALVLGEEGAVVYVTGRSVRGEPTTLGRPGTIDDTAEELTARGAQASRFAATTRTTRRSRRSSSGFGASAATSTCWSTTRGAATSSPSITRRRSGKWSGATGT